MNVKAIMGLAVVALAGIISLALFSGSAVAESYATPLADVAAETHMFVKNIMIWFMLMLVAFLMIFIKKYEWGVALAVLVSAAGAFIVYLALAPFVFDLTLGGSIPYEEVWNQELMLMGVICAITVVIAIGCFLGKLKMWQYFLVGLLFAPVFLLVEWVMFVGLEDWLGYAASDAGGSMLVHMAAAYFGLGVAIALREKRAFNEPMYTTTHSVSFVWLAAMLLWVLWPSFVTALLPMDMVFWGMMVCYMGGIGSILSAWLVCTIIQKKVNPLIYTYAMLAGPVAIGAPLLMLGPWAALLVGLVAGAVSALSFIYLQPFLCAKLKTLDVMGVHNLHGVAGWIGVVVSVIAITMGAEHAAGADAVSNIIAAVFVFVATLILGIVVGIILKVTRGSFTDEQAFSDDDAFIKSEAPA